MTDASPTTQPPVETPTPTKSILPLLSLIFAGVAFLLAFGAPGVAWLPAVAAIVLAIVALVKKAQPRILAIIAIILAPLAWLIAIIVAVAGLAAGTGSSLESSAAEDPAVEQEQSTDEEAGDQEADDEATLGQTVTNSDDVAVTFQSVTCGIATAGPQFFEETAKGQFCEVRYNVQNGSDEEITLFASDVTGEIGGVSYESNDVISTFGEDMFSTTLNPGLGTDAVVYIDIPVDAALEYVVYKPEWSFLTSEVRVRVS